MANLECWHCGNKGHVRTSCRKATPEQIAEWQSASLRRPAKKSEEKNSAQSANSVVASTPEGNELAGGLRRELPLPLIRATINLRGLLQMMGSY